MTIPAIHSLPMAKLYIVLLLLSTFAISRSVPDNPDTWFRTLPRRKQKSVVLHIYTQGPAAGPNATIYEVARASITAASPTQFGQVRVLDNKITATPDRNSAELGRVQGMITSSDLKEVALVLHGIIYFTTGPFNGSTLSVLGRNPLGRMGRELPIVGGSGIFRMAQGYAVENTYSFDSVENYFVMEITAYVYYYE